MADQTGTESSASAVLTVAPVDEVPVGTARRFDVDGHRLAVVRLAGTGDSADEIHVIGDRCSHADFSLAEGELDAEERTLECWKHGSAFSLETGQPTCLPAIKPVPVYAARVVDGTIVVEVSTGDDTNGARA